MAENEPEKKIIVDEDWKAQAQQEKERLEAEQRAEQDRPETSSQAGGPGGRGLPEAEISVLIGMFATQAMFALGVIHEQGSAPPSPDPQMARFNIDMLAMLEEKTRGNLTEDEAAMLQDTLAQVRMLFVQVCGPA